MRVSLLGVRGSRPAPGHGFARVGGHTSCVAIGPETGPPRLLLDAGSGLVNYPHIADGAFRGTVILGHLHWDHVMGLPFFRAGDTEGSRVRLLLPEQGADPRLLMDRVLAPPLFPIDFSGLRGDWTIEAYDEGEHLLEGFHVLVREIPHKGGRTMGLRVSDGTSAIAYLSDHDPRAFGPGLGGWGSLHRAARELASGVDLLIHDAQYLASELDERRAWGHSTPGYAVQLAEAAGAGRVVLFHHDPSRSDPEADALAAQVAATTQLPVSLGVERATFVLGRSGPGRCAAGRSAVVGTGSTATGRVDR